MTDELLNALDECLARLLQGDSLETALGRYPALAEDLRPLLETAYQAAQASYVLGGSEPEALPKLQSAQRAYFLAQAADQRNRTAVVGLPKRAQWRRWFSWVWHPAYVALFVMVVLVSGYGLTAAAYQSLPGDALYGLKRVVENTQLSLADDLTRAKLQKEFEARRLAEIQALAQQGRALPVDFVGVIQQRRETFWLVSDLTVLVTPETVIVGALEPGQRVRVQGDLQADGTISAVLLQGLDAPLPGATLEPAPTLTLAPSATNPATSTPVAIPSNTATPAPTRLVASPTSTVVPPTTLATRSSTPRPASNTDTPVPPPASDTPGPFPTNTQVSVPSNTPLPPPTTPAATGFPAPTNTPAPSTPVPTDTPIGFPAPTETPAPFPTNTQVYASPTPP